MGTSSLKFLLRKRWSDIVWAKWRRREPLKATALRIPKKPPRSPEDFMQAIAKARYVRISPRKVDQILMLVRGKSVANALSTLRLVTKSSRPLVEKILTSALHNTGKQPNAEQWYVQQAWVGYGPTMKRMRAHA